MVVTDTGDDLISPNTTHLWNLVYDVLSRFQCPVMFKEFGPDCPREIDLYLSFFVPKNHPRCEEVIEFLKQELLPMERPGQKISTNNGPEYYFGVVCSIHRYSGPDIYIDQLTSQAMAHHYQLYLQEKIRELRVKGKSHIN